VKEGGGGGAVARPPTDESAAIAIRSKEWDNAIDLVHTIRISKIEAKKLYKLAEKELDNCLASFSTNPNAKGGSNRILYFESAVEALALRLHGGVNGHAKYVARRVETAKKKKSTRDFNAGR
ncbi:uncharacterized protein JCM6883_001746, partial [Sporobolomyces salmoneus]|uniref:uncharacterized protein n=1 Tax=Sporobolomyces salmoneus TaxID=183962 RepID=UPI003171EA36